MMVQRQLYFSLIAGIVLGFTLAYVILAPHTIYRPLNTYHFSNKYDRILEKPPAKQSHYHGHELDAHGHDEDDNDIHNSEEMERYAGPDEDVGSHDENDTFHQMTNRRVANILYNKVRVLCWVMTGPQNYESKAKHVKATWGKRCNILLFMSSTADDKLPAIALPVGEGRDNLWGKTKEAFKYVYENYFDEADWFMKADDDTYVVLENLRYMLLPTSPDTPIYFGCRFKPYTKQGYMSGGAGYVLSREALKRFVEKGLTESSHCRKDNNGAEDVEMGKCLEELEVAAGDSRDPEGRGRFFPFTPEHHLIPGHVDKSFWYWKYIYYDEKQGLECCSDNAISFHYVKPDLMYALEFLIYHLRPFGIAYIPKLPVQLLEGDPTLPTDENPNVINSIEDDSAI